MRALDAALVGHGGDASIKRTRPHSSSGLAHPDHNPPSTTRTIFIMATDYAAVEVRDRQLSRRRVGIHDIGTRAPRVHRPRARAHIV